MATVTICDVKCCGDIIKGDVFNTQIANKKYQLCKKCSEGLLKFLDDNLNAPDSKISPIEKISIDNPKMKDFLDKMAKTQSTIKNPSYYEFAPNVIYTTPSFGTSDITWTVTSGGLSDVFKK